jgi:2-polyprenyl-3-methyl-5-hydroxy-6-metoxy-1,4-benzoquinol methylase
MPKSTVEELIDNYHTLTGRPDVRSQQFQKTVFRFFERALLKLLPPDKEALIRDAGCGEGAFLLFLKSKGYTNISGIDLSPENVAISNEMGLAVVQDDITKSTVWPDAPTYDAIVALDVIEHLPKPEVGPFLARLRLSLKPGGKLILQTPNMGSLFAMTHRYADLSHEFGVTELSAVSLLLIAGFECGEITILPSWNATTALGRAREIYLSILHRLWTLAEGQGRIRIPTKNLIIIGSRND